MIFRRIIIAIKKVNADNQPVKILSNFLGFGLIGFSIYILISLISYNAADSAYFYQTNDPNVMNLGGPLGAVVSDILLSTLGLGSYLLLLFISLWSLESLAPKIFNLSSPKFLFRIIPVTPLGSPRTSSNSLSQCILIAPSSAFLNILS